MWMLYIFVKDKYFLSCLKCDFLLVILLIFLSQIVYFFLFFRNRDLIECFICYFDFVVDIEEVVGFFFEFDEGIGGIFYSNVQFICIGFMGVDIEDIYKMIIGFEKGVCEYNI